MGETDAGRVVRPSIRRRGARPHVERLEPRWLLALAALDARGGLLAPPPSSNSGGHEAVIRPMLMAEATFTDDPGVISTPDDEPRIHHIQRYPIPLLDEALEDLAGSSNTWVVSRVPSTLMDDFPIVSIPAHDHVQITDSLDLVRSERLYRIPIDWQTASLAIKIQAGGPDRVLNEGVTLLDARGTTLTSITPPPGCQALVLNLGAEGIDRVRKDGAVFLRLSMNSGKTTEGTPASPPVGDSEMTPPPSSWESTTANYVLTVQRTSWDGPDPSGASEVLFGGDHWMTAAVRTEALTGTMAASTIQSLSPPTGPAFLALTVRNVARPGRVNGPIGTGPLPSLGAGPIGGILAPDGGEPTVADRPDPGAVDLVSQDGAFLSGPIPGDDDDGASTHAPATEFLPAGSVVAAVPGPGGVPLYGATLETEGVGSGDFMPPELPRAAAGLVAELAARDADSASEYDLASRPVASHRLPIFAGLTFALLLSFRLTRPDLVDPVKLAGTWAASRRFSLSWRRRTIGRTGLD